MNSKLTNKIRAWVDTRSGALWPEDGMPKVARFIIAELLFKRKEEKAEFSPKNLKPPRGTMPLFFFINYF